MRFISSIALIAVPLLAALPALAHDHVRVVGVITRVQQDWIEVKSVEGTTASIDLDGDTKIARDGRDAKPADLSAGLTVVVDAYGDNYSDLLALNIRIVPAIAPGN